MRHQRKIWVLSFLLIALALPIVMAQAQTPTSTPTPAPSPTLVPSPAQPTLPPAPPQATDMPSGTSVDTAINVGDTVEGELSDEGLTHRYTFTGEQGDVVSITLSSSDFDSYLTLLDEDGIVLTTNDDGAGSLNSLIDSFVLPADGAYTIEASSFSRFSTGGYTLSIVEGSAPPVTVNGNVVTQDGGDISIGDTAEGTLGGNSLSTTYTFQGEAGQVVTITLTSEDFDTYLRLQDTSGFEVATDDDSAGNLDSRIGPFTLTDNGTYTIIVESFGGSSSGSYRLSLSTAEVDIIEYTQTIDGAFTEGSFSALYTFSGQAGDVITISMNSDDFDSYLTLSESGQSGFSLITDDDSGGNLNSLIGPFTLPSSGGYIITASSLGGTSVGSYTLRLNRVELESIEVGDTLEATVNENTSSLFYSFDAEAGQVVSITVDSNGTLDTTLVVRGPDGYQVGYDDDSGGSYDPEINRLALTQTGTYIIVVQPYSVGDTGDLTIELLESELRSLDDGPQQVSLNDKRFEDFFSLTGNAGERVRFTLTVRNGTASPNVVVNQNGVQIGSANGTTVSSLVFEVEVPSDGDLLIQIYDYSYTSVVFDVEAERLDE